MNIKLMQFFLNFIRDNLIFTKELILRYHWVFFLTVIVFITGFLTPFFESNQPKIQLLNYALSRLQTTHDSNIFIFIFKNNLLVMFLILLSSITVIIPLLVLFTNGSILNLVSVALVKLLNIPFYSASFFSIPLLLASLLPHGIIEIPTLVFEVFFALLLGLKLYFPKKIMPDLSRKKFFLRIISVYLTVFIPLILVAALIESSITAYLVKASVNLTITKISSATYLQDKVVQLTDLLNLGYQFNESNSPDNLLVQQTVNKYIGTIVFDDQVYQFLQQTKPMVSYIHKSYVVNGKLYLYVYLWSYESDEDAQFMVDFGQHQLELYKEKNLISSITKIGSNLWQVRIDSSESIIETQRVGSYVYSVTFNGNDSNLVNQIANIQMKKLTISTIPP